MKNKEPATIFFLRKTNMKYSDITKKATDELHVLSNSLREELRTFRFGGAGSRKRDVKQGRTLRADIARVETELSARKIADQVK